MAVKNPQRIFAVDEVSLENLTNSWTFPKTTKHNDHGARTTGIRLFPSFPWSDERTEVADVGLMSVSMLKSV